MTGILLVSNHWKGWKRETLTQRYLTSSTHIKEIERKLTGVFKLLRLKSNRTLRAFQPRNKRIQSCSRCKRTGHNASNRSCPALADLTDLIEDDEEDAAEEVMDTEALDEDAGDEDLADIEDLLESDEELF